MKPLLFSFDIGHASIGWAVMDTTRPAQPDLQGCGTVLFPTDDCLAKVRRQMRRQRRHVRSTRVRIARLKQLFLHLGVLSQEELDQPGSPWPWKLAARVLAGGDLLSWRELWDVLRWYAHNRGYDGNRNWAGDDEEDAEDTEKVTQARHLMEQFSCSSMCATICAKLGVDPLATKKSSSHRAYKTSNAAFPREVVTDEVRDLLRKHEGHRPFVTPVLIQALCAGDNSKDDQGTTVRQHLADLGFNARLPGRYVGGLLFGQAVPRFDNRIIGICPVSGQKKPLKDCREFLDYRWAMVLANVRVRRTPEGELEPLTAAEREALTQKARLSGDFTAKEFQAEIEALTGSKVSNVEAMMTHPDSQMALVLDPVLKLTQSNQKLKDLWPMLPPEVQKRALGRWRKGRRVTLDALLLQVPSPDKARALLDKLYADTVKRIKKKESIPTKEAFLRQPLRPDWPSGRAPYAREVMRAAYEQVMQAQVHPMEEGGVLYITDEMKQRERDKDIDQLTNNHLVRHRLKILLRLIEDMVKTYADNDPANVQRCVIEVARDLLEYSGKTKYDIDSDLKSRLKDHGDATAGLIEAMEGEVAQWSGNLVRKARIAQDLDNTCPYTGQRYCLKMVIHGKVEKEHIIPKSARPSDSLDSLVLTFPEINRLKQNRTARQFVREFAGHEVQTSGGTVTIWSEEKYLAFVAKHGPNPTTKPTAKMARKLKCHLDDLKRKWLRRQKLELVSYEEREFTPRDLAVTSHLCRMAAAQMEVYFGDREKGRLRARLPKGGSSGNSGSGGLRQSPVVITSLPGQVTAEVRKSWKILGCLAHACPEIMHEVPDLLHPGSTKREPRPKSEIRDITHLHHALDACVMGYAALLLPNNGKLWQQLLTRKITRAEQPEFTRLHGSSPLLSLAPWNRESPGSGPLRLMLGDLPAAMKNQIATRLLERRVVQHVPADMSGAKLNANPMGVVTVKDGMVELRQREITGINEDGSRQRQWKKEKGKPLTRRVSRVVGLQEGKLSRIGAVLDIEENYGIALLGNEASIIPFFKVRAQMNELAARNGGRAPMVLRLGMLIRVPRGDYAGVWRVRSCKDNARDGILVTLSHPERVPASASGVTWSKDNVRLKTLRRDGLEIITGSFCGVPLTGGDTMGAE